MIDPRAVSIVQASHGPGTIRKSRWSWLGFSLDNLGLEPPQLLEKDSDGYFRAIYLIDKQFPEDFDDIH